MAAYSVDKHVDLPQVVQLCWKWIADRLACSVNRLYLLLFGDTTGYNLCEKAFFSHSSVVVVVVLPYSSLIYYKWANEEVSYRPKAWQKLMKIVNLHLTSSYCCISRKTPHRRSRWYILQPKFKLRHWQDVGCVSIQRYKDNLPEGLWDFFCTGMLLLNMSSFLFFTRKMIVFKAALGKMSFILA